MVPQAPLGPFQISRLLCGSNPFVGCSYRSSAHDAWQRKTFTADRIGEIYAKCLEVGINTVLGNGNEEWTIGQGLQRCEQKVGARPNWIAYANAAPGAPLDYIERIADEGAIAAYVQGGTIDSCFSYNYVGGLDLSKPDTLDNVNFWLDDIRGRGMIAGLCTHHARIISICEERGYSAEFYVTPLNFVDVYCDYPAAVRAIRQTSKPVIAIKPLGGGGIVKPEKGLTCAFASIKPTDFVTVGVENEETVEYNARLVTSLIEILR